MNRSFNYITVDNPKIPVFETSAPLSVPFGQFTDASHDASSAVDRDAIKVSVQDLYLPNFSMRKSEGEFEHDAVLLNTSSKGIHLLGSCLFLKGHVKSHLQKHHEIIESYQGTQNFKYDPQNEFSHKIPARTPFNFIHFSVAPDYFLQFLPENEGWAEKLRTRIFRQERILGERAPKIARAQEQALQTIFDCPLSGKLGDLMMQTAIVQIILLQLHSLFQNEATPLTRIGKRDMNLAHGLRDHLSKTFLDDHSLTDLAKHFGTNSNKLITLFKRTFDKSIFEYLSELKMDHARRLLLEEQLVTEVSRAVGYKNPNHFSVAFKKKFGINPSQVK